MPIIIRVDDVGLNEDKDRDLDMKSYSKFHKLFAERNVPYCPAVIPAICTVEMRMWMESNWYSGVDTILHGWDHEDRIYNGKSTEFEGLSPIEQNKRIDLGKKFLHTLFPCGFSAPFNRYDDDTIKAVYDNSMRYFFAGYGREKEELFEEKFGCVILPAEESLYVRDDAHIDIVLDVLESLPEREQPYVMTLHCTWHYRTLNSSQLDKLLDAAMRKQVVSVKTIKGVNR